MSTIKTLNPGGLDRAAETLGRAFSGHPLFSWIFPDPVRRPLLLRQVMWLLLEYGSRYGHVAEAHNGYAAAIWLPPGRTITKIGMIRSGALALPLRIGFRSIARLLRANRVTGRLRKRHASGRHWYLLIVGVDHELQGNGLGTALVEAGLARVDRENCPCYLETSEYRNLAFYERHGFIVAGKATHGIGGLTIWGMRRESRGST